MAAVMMATPVLSHHCTLKVMSATRSCLARTPRARAVDVITKDAIDKAMAKRRCSSGNPGALPRRGPLRTGRARFRAARLKQALRLGPGRSAGLCRCRCGGGSGRV